MAINWYRYDGIVAHGEDGPVTVAEVRYATEGEADGSIGAFARLLGSTHAPSPAGFYYVATLEARGVWCRPVGPFDTLANAIDACDKAYAARR